MCPATLARLTTHVLPARQAHYAACCATLARARAAGAARSIDSAQQVVSCALRVLNVVRVALGLPAAVGPALLSLDELLALGAGKTSPAALLAAADQATASTWVVASIHEATNALAA